jgi:hypothetical protein
MSVAKILKDQSEWVRQATRTIVRNRVTEADTKFPDEVRTRRRAQIQARIAMLERQREQAAKRFETAIAEAKEELEQLGSGPDLRNLQADAGTTPQAVAGSQGADSEATPRKSKKRRAPRARQ